MASFAEEWTDEYDEDVVIIIDNGSGLCKAGLAINELPMCVFEEAVAEPRDKGKPKKDDAEPELVFGDDVFTLKQHKVKHPIENGIIEDYDAMERLWEYTFVDKLEVNPATHPVLLTEPPFNPKLNRERMAEIMFETFGVPSLNISIQGVLAIMGAGRTSGVVLDSGEGVTHTVPIYESYCMQHGIQRLDLAGRDLNTLLAKLLSQENIIMTTTTEQQELRKIKEKHCYIALEPSSEFAEEKKYKMPDGKEISLMDEMWKCPEALFAPSIVGLEATGVAGLVWESVCQCDIDTRKLLLQNVVISGGSTMFPGFSERLTKELRGHVPTAVQAAIRVLNTTTKGATNRDAVWIGGHVASKLRQMQENLWMNIEDYDEYGVSFIHDKCSVKYN